MVLTQVRPANGVAMDIGEMLTRDQMDEYREARERRERGEATPRLDWAARACVVLLVLVVAGWIIWSVQQPR